MTDTFERLLDTREQLASAKAMLGECIHALNLAAGRIDQSGGDGSLFREMAEQASKERWR